MAYLLDGAILVLFLVMVVIGSRRGFIKTIAGVAAFVVALGIMVGALVGFDSVEFAMCVVFASVVMYDATGVRRETGIQAQVINEILRQVFINGKPIAEDDLKELVGHKPLEVLAGAILGLITAVVYILL